VTAKTFVLLMVLDAFFPTARVCAQQGGVTGFFSDMYVSSKTGDIGGATIFISYAGGETGIQYYAFVQTAEGVPSKPTLAPVTVDGDSITINFTDGSYKDISPFTGRVRGDTLIGRFSNRWGFRLPRMVFAERLGDANRAPVADRVVWKIGLRGAGPIRYGMTLAEASRVLGETLEVETTPGEKCGYVQPSAAPWGVSLLVIDSVVEGVEVHAGPAATISGASLKSTEAEVKALYPGRIEVQPLPDAPDARWSRNLLIYVPQDSSNGAYRLLFQTFETKVMMYRAGLWSAVAYVGGCS